MATPAQEYAEAEYRAAKEKLGAKEMDSWERYKIFCDIEEAAQAILEVSTSQRERAHRIWQEDDRARQAAKHEKERELLAWGFSPE